MKLEALTLKQCEDVRIWRNAEPRFLRTSYLLTQEMQEDFYRDVVCNRDSRHRYFAIMGGGRFIGMTGLTDIQFENSTAEISLILSPDERGKGYGRKSVKLILEHAFYGLGLVSVFGEVYDCGNVRFWHRIVELTNGFETRLPNRKMHEGMLYGSMWFQLMEVDQL